jgi:AcrR family transcriptional regulator
VAETRQAGTLARTYEGQPGLPRGRSRLPPPAVSASQRERLLRSVIAAVSECGYPTVTIADIVRRARVSRKAFYAHFANKEECFLTATDEGGKLMIKRSVSATRALPAGASDEDLLRAACRGYLRFLADEPAFARVFYIHLSAAGARAARRLDAGTRGFAVLNRRWHEHARERHPDWPAVPPEAYLALGGATTELARSMVYADRIDDLPELEDTLVALHLAVLAGRPWPPGS